MAPFAARFAALFGSPASLLGTVLLLALAGVVLPDAWRWAVADAHWRADWAACRAPGAGACWGVVAEKLRFIVFGRYPYAEQWRPLVATLLLLAALLLAGLRAGRTRGAWLLGAVLLAGCWLLLKGGVAGLSTVDTDRWGGLPLTVLLSVLSIAMAFPLAVLLALGRQSGLPAVRALCTVFIETLRGLPLVSVLFMAAFMAPLLMPAGTTVDVLYRVLLGITLFSAAGLAEVVRGGLQGVPVGQLQAALALGMSYWQLQLRVVLPQALSWATPGIVNSFVGIFKDTSLITVVSLYELTGSLGLALDSDVNWRPYKIEGYVFIAALYFAFCFSISRYGVWLERRADRPYKA